MGHFPDEALSRVEEVQRLKKQGLSMSTISDRFRNKLLGNSQLPQQEETHGGEVQDKVATLKIPETTDPPPVDSEMRQRRHLTLELSIDDIPGPAYMVNNNFELVWWNDLANESLLGISGKLSGEIEARNLIRLLMGTKPVREWDNWHELLYIHLSTAKKRLPHQSLIKIYSCLSAHDIQILEQLYEAASPVDQVPIMHYPTTLMGDSGVPEPYTLYASFFREGILFAYVSPHSESSSLLELLSRRDQVIRDLMRKRKPFFTNVAVMVADLQNSVRICSELPAEEYFELINHIWQTSEPVFRKYYGTHGKHVGDGMVYYFFPQPDCDYLLNAMHCALELKEVMRNISREWQNKKGWLNDLYLNIGLNEGQEWFGTYHNGNHLEFTVLGDTINHAARISDFARNGSIWTTKNMLSQVAAEQRRFIHFGIRRRTDRDEEVLVSEMYARISSLVDLDEGRHFKFRDIAMLPITEIFDIEIQPEAEEDS